MRAVEPRQEISMIRSFTSTSQHAGRQHSEQVGQIVARLIAQATDLEMASVRNGFRCWWRSADYGERSSSAAKTVEATSRCAAISLVVPSPHKQLSLLPTLYADEKLDGVLFKTCYSEKNGEESVLGAIREQAPVAFALLLGELPCYLTCYISCDII